MDSKIETTKCNFTIDRKIRYYKHNLFNIYINISNLISQLQYKFDVTDEMNIIKKGTGKHLIHTRNPMAKNEICGFDSDGNIIKGEHEFNNTDIIEKLIIIKNEYENKDNNEGKMKTKKSDIYNLEDSTNIKIIKTSHHIKLLLDRQMKEIKSEYEEKEKLKYSELFINLSST